MPPPSPLTQSIRSTPDPNIGPSRKRHRAPTSSTPSVSDTYRRRSVQNLAKAKEEREAREAEARIRLAEAEAARLELANQKTAVEVERLQLELRDEIERRMAGE